MDLCVSFRLRTLRVFHQGSNRNVAFDRRDVLAAKQNQFSNSRLNQNPRRNFGENALNTKSILAFVLLDCLAGLAGAGTIKIPLVTVGDPGNVADSATGFGAVPYSYKIGEYDVTITEYTAFLNAVATSDQGDPYRLYDSRMANSGASFGLSFGLGGFSVTGNGSMPATWVTWGDAARFVNWLANGQPTGPEGAKTTETGTYTLNGAMTDAALMAVTRNPGSIWVLPNVNEWYKAAYYVGGGSNAGYWTYATQSNTPPSSVLSVTGTNNANYSSTDFANILTPVGAFAASPSAYGTYDQSGDVWEWNETAYFGNARGLRGGSYGDPVSVLVSGVQDNITPLSEDINVGFRVAYVPEPSSAAMLIAAAVAICLFHKAYGFLKHERIESCVGAPGLGRR